MKAVEWDSGMKSCVYIGVKGKYIVCLAQFNARIHQGLSHLIRVH